MELSKQDLETLNRLIDKLTDAVVLINANLTLLEKRVGGLEYRERRTGDEI